MAAISLGGTLWRVTDAQGVEHIVSVSEANNDEAGAEAAVAQMLAPPAEVIEAMRLAAFRASLTCSPLQGRLALGPTICAQIDAMAADPNTPWEKRQAILHAKEWLRTSAMIADFGALFGFTEEQMDALFVTARGLAV